MEVSGHFHDPAALPSRKEPLVQTGLENGCDQSWYGRGDEEKNFQPLPRLEPPIIQPVAQRYITELSRL
jgi:hypothetical protein